MTVFPPMPRSKAATLGAAIRRAREHRGLTQADLAASLGRTQAAVSYWEQGRRAPDLDDLFELVALLELDLDQLFEASPREPTRVVLRAETQRVYMDDVSEALDDFVEHVERVAAPPIELRIANDSPVGAAIELLTKAGVAKPPVPVDKLAHRCGIRVAEFVAVGGISGLLVELESGPAIGYRSGEAPVRQRFTVAHELGHHLLRHYDNFHIDPDKTAADGHPPDYDWHDERAANDFAAQLLMPGTWITQRYKRATDLPRLAQEFQVSQTAMTYRLANLGLR